MTNNVTSNSNSSLEGQRENSTTPADWNNFTFDHFSKITETTGKIREELDKLSQCNSGKPSEKAKIIAPITNWFLELETKMNDLSKYVFNLSATKKR